ESESSSAHEESSSAAASVTALRVSSTLPESFSGGSIGRSAFRSSASTSAVGWAPGFSVAICTHLLVELLDRPVDQHLGGPIASAQGAGDLSVVHPQCEAHDQRLAPVVGQLLQVVHHALQLLPALDDPLRAVRRRNRLGFLEDALGAAGPVAVVVRG